MAHKTILAQFEHLLILEYQDLEHHMDFWKLEHNARYSNLDIKTNVIHIVNQIESESRNRPQSQESLQQNQTILNSNLCMSEP